MLLKNDSLLLIIFFNVTQIKKNREEEKTIKVVLYIIHDASQSFFLHFHLCFFLLSMKSSIPCIFVFWLLIFSTSDHPQDHCFINFIFRPVHGLPSRSSSNITLDFNVNHTTPYTTPWNDTTSVQNSPTVSLGNQSEWYRKSISHEHGDHDHVLSNTTTIERTENNHDLPGIVFKKQHEFNIPPPHPYAFVSGMMQNILSQTSADFATLFENPYPLSHTLDLTKFDLFLRQYHGIAITFWKQFMNQVSLFLPVQVALSNQFHQDMMSHQQAYHDNKKQEHQTTLEVEKYIHQAFDAYDSYLSQGLPTMSHQPSPSNHDNDGSDLGQVHDKKYKQTRVQDFNRITDAQVSSDSRQLSPTRNVNFDNQSGFKYKEQAERNPNSVKDKYFGLHLSQNKIMNEKSEHNDLSFGQGSWDSYQTKTSTLNGKNVVESVERSSSSKKSALSGESEYDFKLNNGLTAISSRKGKNTLWRRATKRKSTKSSKKADKKLKNTKKMEKKTVPLEQETQLEEYDFPNEIPVFNHHELDLSSYESYFKEISYQSKFDLHLASDLSASGELHLAENGDTNQHHQGNINAILTEKDTPNISGSRNRDQLNQEQIKGIAHGIASDDPSNGKYHANRIEDSSLSFVLFLRAAYQKLWILTKDIELLNRNHDIQEYHRQLWALNKAMVHAKETQEQLRSDSKFLVHSIKKKSLIQETIASRLRLACDFLKKPTTLPIQNEKLVEEVKKLTIFSEYLIQLVSLELNEQRENHGLLQMNPIIRDVGTAAYFLLDVIVSSNSFYSKIQNAYYLNLYLNELERKLSL